MIAATIAATTSKPPSTSGAFFFFGGVDGASMTVLIVGTSSGTPRLSENLTALAFRALGGDRLHFSPPEPRRFFQPALGALDQLDLAVLRAGAGALDVAAIG